MKKIMMLMMLSFLVLCGCEKKETVKEEASKIPELHLHIDGGKEAIDAMHNSEDHSVECTGSFDLIVPDAYDIEQDDLRDVKLSYIRGRGNSTWLADKKPYKIKLEEGEDLFGMGKNNHYVLLANAYDRTFIRNRLVSYLSEKMGMEYTMQGVNIDLYMNDEYLGNYYLSEQVRFGTGRIELEEMDEEEKELPKIEGPYLLSTSPWAEQDQEDIFKTNREVSFLNDTPSFGKEGYENDAQKNYIRDFIQKAEDAIFEGKGIENCIDLESAADYWLIQEFTQNEDAFKTPSTYIYKKNVEEDGTRGKLHFGPLWDFDRSLGNSVFSMPEPSYFNHVRWEWIDELRDREDFKELLIQRWTLLDRILEEVTKKDGLLDKYKNENEMSYDRDLEKWKSFYEENGMDTSKSYADEIEELRTFIDERRKWINENIKDIGKILVKITIKSGLEEDRIVKMRISSFISDHLKASEIDGYCFEGFFLEDGTALDENAIAREDMIIYAKYRKIED